MTSISNTENRYLMLTCSKKIESHYHIYTDDQIPQMFSSHFLQLQDDFPLTELYSLLVRVPDILKRNYVHVKSSFNRDLPFTMKKSLFDLGYILDEELFYSIRLADWKGDSPGVRAEWGTEKSLIDGCRMMQAYDTLSINEAFAKEKLLRKYPFYEEGNIQLCVCYSGEGEPIGCAELYLDQNENVAKIEEVAILEPYQRKGYGSGLIKQMLTAAKQSGMESCYLVTTGSDQVKTFYEKLGFKQEEKLTTIFKYLFE
ncbi:GNAT family N-acetyltransferase [Bacillus haynesii]|uniref:GNAT family N-acetyltransferase n=1 Tax=Bacillus haynesii TaxID=1925021 RepID=UPI002280D255|nr:GNAT family N-acetyltransferase [Bacillus haynesii]MCY8372949.1 GNAT family N-acetyltransferase [Bacillus haynesii]MEC1483313.1 GNAT family N-acetyltransferase [Bacillus haynesii]